MNVVSPRGVDRAYARFFIEFSTDEELRGLAEELGIFEDHARAALIELFLAANEASGELPMPEPASH